MVIAQSNRWVPRLMGRDKIARIRAHVAKVTKSQGEQAGAQTVRELCRKDLFYLCYEVLGYRDLVEPLHDDLCDFIETQEQAQKTNIILIPRGHFKSTIATVGRCIQWMIRDRNTSIGLGSADLKSSKKFLREIRGQLEQNARLKALFPDCFYSEPRREATKWTEEEIIIKRDTTRPTPKEGTVKVFGLEDGLPTGDHYYHMVIDDAINEDNVRTAERIAKVDQQSRYLRPLLMTPDQPINWVGTRYHLFDIYQRFTDNLANAVYLRQALEDNKPIFPERFSHKTLEDTRIELGSYIFSCTPPDAPILMSDWTFKPISEVQIGDKVIGWVHPESGGKTRSELQVSEVLGVLQQPGYVQKMTLENGNVIKCTADHKWYTGRNPTKTEPHRKRYAPAKIGSRLYQITDAHYPEPTVEQYRHWAYLAGIVDGEGACKHGNFSIYQCPNHNPEVSQKMQETMNALGIEYGISKTETGAQGFHIKGGREVKARLIRHGRPAKSFQLLKYMRLHGPMKGSHKVTNIELDGDEAQPVYALQTTTGNYVAYGYASSNCQYMLQPTDPADKKFKREWLKWYTKEISKTYGHVFFLVVDPASRMRKASDFTAMLVFGIDHDMNFYLVDGVHDKLNPAQRIDAVFRLTKKWDTSTIAYETIGFQETDKFYIDQRQTKDRHYFNVIEITGHKTRKDERIMGLQPIMEGGKFHLPESPILYQRLWESPDDGKGVTVDIVQEFLSEFDFFPNSAHDDLLDAAQMARNIVEAGHIPLPKVFYSDSIDYGHYNMYKKEGEEMSEWIA